MKKKIVILASGKGTNAEAIMQYCSEKSDILQVVGLISDKKDAYTLERAKKFDIPDYFIPHESQDSLLSVIKKLSADWACLAGYMRIVSKDFLQLFKSNCGSFYQVLNIHPSLLPAFPGLNAYKRAFDAGLRTSGITVHLVNETLDGGPIVKQKNFTCGDNEDFAAFYEKGRAIEKSLYQEALSAIAEDRLIVEASLETDKLLLAIKKKE